MSIDSVVYAHVFDPVKYSYGVENALMGLQNLTATTLRSVIGDMELDQTLSSRAEINGRMQVILDEATDNWGLKVTRVEIKNIQPPKEIEEVMTKQMRAERERRQTILEAQAHKEAVVSRAEGDKQAKILAAEAERDAQRALAEGRAAAIEIVSVAEAANLKRLSESGVNEAVLRLKAMEAMKDVSDGQATKIFIPNDLSKSLAFSGLVGEMLGTAKDPATNVKPRGQLRHDNAMAVAQALADDDDCLKPGVTQETRSASAVASKNVAATALRSANPNATPSMPPVSSSPASKYLGR
jgi:regulator of protease activity HflC (stomatin/prohibitin superfamily)